MEVPNLKCVRPISLLRTSLRDGLVGMCSDSVCAVPVFNLKQISNKQIYQISFVHSSSRMRCRFTMRGGRMASMRPRVTIRGLLPVLHRRRRLFRTFLLLRLRITVIATITIIISIKIKTHTSRSPLISPHPRPPLSLAKRLPLSRTMDRLPQHLHPRASLLLPSRPTPRRAACSTRLGSLGIASSFLTPGHLSLPLLLRVLRMRTSHRRCSRTIWHRLISRSLNRIPSRTRVRCFRQRLRSSFCIRIRTNSSSSSSRFQP